METTEVTIEDIKNSKELLRKLMQKMYQLRGYLVIWRECKCELPKLITKVGSVDFHLSPTEDILGILIEETSMDDLVEQCKLAGIKDYTPPNFGFCYKLVLD